jgi:hypothetical protein
MIKTEPIKIEMRRVRADELEIHPLAQRRLLPSKVARLSRELNRNAVGVIHAVEQTKRGKKRLYVIDGYHRIKAILERRSGDWLLNVHIYLDVDDEAACVLFLRLNDRSPVAPFDKYMAELNSDDAIAVGAQNVCKNHNLEVSRTKGTGKICCVTTIKRLFSWDKGAILVKTLDISQGAWGERANSGGAALEGVLLEGLARFIRQHDGELDSKSLIRKLAKFPGGPGKVIGDARAQDAYLKGSIRNRICDVIAAIYNKGKWHTAIEG